MDFAKYSLRRRQVTDGAPRFVLLSLFVPVLAHAQDESGLLDEFTNRVLSLDAQFVQEMLDADGFVIQAETSTGRFRMQRPGRFNLHEQAPFETYVVADGELVWHHDVELESASCTPLSELASVTTLFLGVEGSIEDDYAVMELAPENGMRRLELTPEDSRSSDFVSAIISFDDGIPVMLQTVDGLEQKHRWTFSDIEVNPEIPDDAFEFDPPRGVDIDCDFD